MLVNRFDLGEDEEIRAEILEEGGHLLIDLWVYDKKKEGVLVPTEKGLKVPARLLSRLKGAILDLEEALAKRELAKQARENVGPSQKKEILFAHPSEEELANLLDFYRIPWLYEPHSFPIKWDRNGNVVESFTPDFYLIDRIGSCIASFR